MELNFKHLVSQKKIDLLNVCKNTTFEVHIRIYNVTTNIVNV